MRNLKLLVLIPLLIALSAIVKLAFTGALSVGGIGHALVGVIPEMIVLPTLIYFLALNPRRLPETDGSPKA
jgi:hypothetical protein